MLLIYHFKSMFLTNGMSVRLDISIQGMQALFSDKKKRKTCDWYLTICL